MTRHVSFYSAMSLVTLCAAVLLVGGCGSADEADSAWTVTEGELTLAEDLFVADNDDFYFGQIYDVAVREDGRIYVTDGGEHHVKVLSPEGELLQTIGRQGEGPGEFEMPTELALARGDSLYVLDRRGRVSVFTPDHDFEYSFMARDEAASGRFMMVPEEREDFLFFFSPGAAMVAKGADGAVRAMRADGTVGDTLFTATPYQMVWEELDRGMRFYTLPFARVSHLALGSDGQVHHAWSDSLYVRIYDRTGERLRTVDVPFEPVPVTEEDRSRALEGRAEESRAMVSSEIPDMKPAFDRFLVEDGGRYWFKRPTEDHEQADWWIANPEAQHVDVVSLPSAVDLMVVRDEYAYGRTASEGGAPALVRYRIDERQQASDNV